MKIVLPEDLSRQVHEAMIRGSFATEADVVRQALLLLQTQPGTNLPAPVSTPNVWELVSGLLTDVPDERFDRIPTDGSEHHDHYLYGVAAG